MVGELNVQEGKVFIGGLSWETTDERLRRYFENYGVVQEAFVSYDRQTGRPRGFGFVIFADPTVADKVVAIQHTIDRRQVEAKKALPKEESPISKDQQAAASGQRTKKIFVGGLAASVDQDAFKAYFEEFGTVEDAVVMYDQENSRSRGFGFITFTEEEAVDNVFAKGAMHALHDKQIEIKRAVPRDAMMPSPRMMYRSPPPGYGGRSPYGGGHRYHHMVHNQRNYGTPPPHGFGRGRGGPDGHHHHQYRSPQPMRGGASPGDHHHHHHHHPHHHHHGGPGMHHHHPHHHHPHHSPHPHHHSPHPHHGMYTPPVMGGMVMQGGPAGTPPGSIPGGDPSVAASPQVIPVPGSSGHASGDPAMQSPSQLVGGFSLQNGMAPGGGASVVGSPPFTLDQQQQGEQQQDQQQGNISMASVSEALADALQPQLDAGGEQQQQTIWS